MSNVIKMINNKEIFMVMPIRDVLPDPKLDIMNGNMFVAFTKKDNKIEFLTPQRLDLNRESLENKRLEPLAIESFIAEGFTVEDVLNSAPTFGNITPPDLVKTESMKREFTTVVMNGTDGRMATYLTKAPAENEEVYLAILDYKVAASIIEDTNKMSQEFQNFVVTIDYNNLDIDISLQSISILKNVKGEIIIPELNGFPQHIEFENSTSLDSIVVKNEPKELQDILDSAMKLYYGSANSEINNQLVDFYFHYIIAKSASNELDSKSK